MFLLPLLPLLVSMKFLPFAIILKGNNLLLSPIKVTLLFSKIKVLRELM